jgi:hypothetical protein
MLLNLSRTALAFCIANRFSYAAKLNVHWWLSWIKSVGYWGETLRLVSIHKHNELKFISNGFSDWPVSGYLVKFRQIISVTQRYSLSNDVYIGPIATTSLHILPVTTNI